jgi:hypothetical protein
MVGDPSHATPSTSVSAVRAFVLVALGVGCGACAAPRPIVHAADPGVVAPPPTSSIYEAETHPSTVTLSPSSPTTPHAEHP